MCEDVCEDVCEDLCDDVHDDVCVMSHFPLNVKYIRKFSNF